MSKLVDELGFIHQYLIEFRTNEKAKVIEKAIEEIIKIENEGSQSD